MRARLKRIHLQNQRVNEARVGIQMKRFDQKREQGGNLGMHQLEEAQPEEERQQTLHHLEHSNHGQAGMV